VLASLARGISKNGGSPFASLNEALKQTRSAHRCFQHGKMFPDSFNDRSGTARTKLVVLDGGSAYTANSVSARQTLRRKERVKEREREKDVRKRGNRVVREQRCPPRRKLRWRLVLTRRSRGNSRRINSICPALRVCPQPRYFMTQARSYNVIDVTYGTAVTRSEPSEIPFATSIDASGSVIEALLFSQALGACLPLG